MPDAMDYLAALRYLYGFADMERGIGFSRRSPREFTFNRVHRLLDAVGSPHRQLRFAHIAGSKGKGSTAAMIASIARAAGWRVGLYTQPHLHSFTERLVVDGKPITPGDLGSLVKGMAGAVDELISEAPELGPPTTYEVITVGAMRHFAERAVDLAVMEVGLGGTWDATNVITPLVCVITSLALEHTAILGESIAEIAGQKAGIAKQGVPLVTVVQSPDAMEVIRERCRAVGAPLTVSQAGTVAGAGDARIRWRRGKPAQACSVRTPATQLDGVLLPLLGDHQLINAGAACLAVDALRQAGLAIDPAAYKAGLESVEWPCRLEVLQRSPLVVADGAHTPEAIRHLTDSLAGPLAARSARVVFGTSVDKRYGQMLAALGPIAAKVYVCASAHPRAAATSELLKAALAAGLAAESYDSTERALEAAMRDAGPDEAVVATGSLFVAAEARQTFGLAEFVDPDLIPRAV